MLEVPMGQRPSEISDDRLRSQTHALLFDVLTEMVSKSESYKFIRMADDLHDVAQYLNDMRLCFIALTVTGYILLIIYALALCLRRNRRNAPRRRNWDYQNDNQRDFNTAQTVNDELTTVRTEPSGAYIGRNHHGRLGADRPPPSFMRHGHLNHQQTTRLISEQDGSVVKHQIPHISTEGNEKTSSASIPQLVKEAPHMDN